MLTKNFYILYTNYTYPNNETHGGINPLSLLYSKPSGKDLGGLLPVGGTGTCTSEGINVNTEINNGYTGGEKLADTSPYPFFVPCERVPGLLQIFQSSNLYIYPSAPAQVFQNTNPRTLDGNINTRDNFEWMFCLGEGVANDSTPVSFTDRDVANKVFDDRMTLTVTKDLNYFNIQATNISNSAITIREMGIYSFWFINYNAGTDGAVTKAAYPNMFGDFIPDSHGDVAKVTPFLIAKVKLTTPAIIQPSETKSIYWQFNMP